MTLSSKWGKPVCHYWVNVLHTKICKLVLWHIIQRKVRSVTMCKMLMIFVTIISRERRSFLTNWVKYKHSTLAILLRSLGSEEIIDSTWPKIQHFGVYSTLKAEKGWGKGSTGWSHCSVHHHISDSLFRATSEPTKDGFHISRWLGEWT